MFDREARLARFATLIMIAATVLAVDRFGMLGRAENAVAEARMALASREAGGGIVFLGIDNGSIEAMGAWPWPRDTYGEIARRLIDAGAVEVFFDIDLSAPSVAASDAALAAVLEEIGGAVILPAFRQSEGIGASAGAMSDNLPLPEFRQHAWLASVNVVPDPDGRVRRYLYGQRIAGEEVPSAASVLAGRFGSAGADFAINFTIRPDSVPSYPVIDLIEGRLGAEQIEGRSIVVGAHALELRDDLPVPVHGIIPGPMLQILAAETLIQGVALTTLPKLPIFGAAAVLAIAAALSGLRRRPGWVVLAFAAAAGIVEVAAFVLQTREALVLPTPILHATLLSLGLSVAASELGLRQWLLQVARVETRNSHNVLQRIISDSSDAIVVTDETGDVIEMSARTCELFPKARQEVGPPTLESVLPLTLAAAAREAMAAFRNGSALSDSVRELTFEVDGTPRHIEYTITPSRLHRLHRGARGAEEVVLGCVTARDVTLAREQQGRLDHLARFDALTGAMTRGELLERVEAALDREPQRIPVAFAFNLHRFKTVNATLGRAVGDQVLQAVAARTARIEPRCLGVSRLGADTFALFMFDLQVADAEAAARRLISALSRSFDLDGASVRVGLRVGIALGRPGTEIADVFENAELALDEAKLTGGDGYRVFAPETAQRQVRARQIERALWAAINNDELHLAYQRQVDLHTGRLVGAEALVRWRHPTLGAVSPAEFIEIAESSGSIERLGSWVLRHACRDAVAWPDGMAVAVNVSPVQFQRGDVVADVRHALAASGLAPHRLHLEITEAIFVGGSDALLWTLDALRELDISIALDDFGSGFSSFGYLARLPLDKLKLDRMFVQALERDSSNEAIVRSVVALSRDLGLTLVCEGVETAAQRDFLVRAGCDQGQGYFFGKPEEHSTLLAAFLADRSLSPSAHEAARHHSASKNLG